MNKEPKEVDWSKQKPGTIGVNRNGDKLEFVASRETSIFWRDGHGFWEMQNNGRLWKDGRDAQMDILLPWESCLAEGHNPDGLTNGQVGDGWRLIGHHTDDPDSRVQYYSHDKKTWFNRDHESGPYLYGGTYRVPITPPVAKVPVAKATKRVPCGPEHFPPGTVIRVACHDLTSWEAVNGVNTHGMLRVGMFVKYEDLKGYERSIDGGKTWLPCYVEVEE